jgi:cell division protein FtsB
VPRRTPGQLKFITELQQEINKQQNQNKNLKNKQMNKFNKFFADHGIKIIIVIMVLTYFKSCSIDSEVERIKKEQRILTTEIDTLSSQIVNEAEMIKLIKEVPAWKTLRIEEISDKERISINALEEKDN